jgi:hypothetical protein
MLPTRIKMTDEQAAPFRALNDKELAMKQFVAMVTQQGEARMRELVGESRKAWEQARSEHALDLDRVKWEFDPEKNELVPVAMKL